MPIVKTIEQPKEIKEVVKQIDSYTPPEVDSGYYNMLEVWGKEVSDPDTQEKVKFISDSLGQSKDSLLHILTEIGQTPQGETKLGRVYKYLRLRQSADKALKNYENIKSSMNFLRNNQWA